MLWRNSRIEEVKEKRFTLKSLTFTKIQNRQGVHHEWGRKKNMKHFGLKTSRDETTC
jgi:hypothetical protein